MNATHNTLTNGLETLPMRPAIEKLCENRILILDGAMGTMVQRYKLQEAELNQTREQLYTQIYETTNTGTHVCVYVYLLAESQLNQTRQQLESLRPRAYTARKQAEGVLRRAFELNPSGKPLTFFFTVACALVLSLLPCQIPR